jgi:hypothetical protein
VSVACRSRSTKSGALSSPLAASNRWLRGASVRILVDIRTAAAIRAVIGTLGDEDLSLYLMLEPSGHPIARAAYVDELLVAARTSKEAPVRARALALASRFRTPAVESAIEAALSDSDPTVRQRALNAMKDGPGDRAFTVARATLLNLPLAGLYEGMNAAEVALSIDPARGAELLTEALRSPSLATSLAAAKTTIRRRGIGAELVSVLARCALTDSLNYSLREECLEGMPRGTVGGSADTLILGTMTKVATAPRIRLGDSGLAEVAAGYLAERDPDLAIRLLRSPAQDRWLHEPEVGRAFVTALQLSQSPTAFEELLGLVQPADERWLSSLREFAFRAVATKTDPRALDALRNAFLASADSTTRVRALWSIANSKDPRTKDVLLEIARGASPSFSRQAVDFLVDRKEVGIPVPLLVLLIPSQRVIEPLIKSSDPAGIDAAIELLVKLEPRDRAYPSFQESSLRSEIEKHLSAISGKKYGTDAKKWQGWWRSERAKRLKEEE